MHLVLESSENISEENILLCIFSAPLIFSVDINQNVNNNTGGKTINIFSAILSIGASLNNFLMKPL